jgi:DNA-binding PadR family transcriptional regulator
MTRIMTTLPPLSGALLGLLHDEPRSGYALRKLFASTAMGTFSDSPGSIYPALRRLAREGLVAGAIENARSLRPRQVYRLTPAGLAALQRWLTEPVVRDRVAADLSTLMLRFVFMPQTIGVTATMAFLVEFERELAAYVAALREMHRTAQGMPVAGRLGIRAGIESLAAHVRWARLARRTLGASRRKSMSKQRS